MTLLKKIQEATPGDTIEVERLTDCCRNMKDLETIVSEIKKKKIRITSQIQPWLTSEVLESLLSEALKAKNNK